MRLPSSVPYQFSETSSTQAAKCPLYFNQATQSMTWSSQFPEKCACISTNSGKIGCGVQFQHIGCGILQLCKQHKAAANYLMHVRKHMFNWIGSWNEGNTRSRPIKLLIRQTDALVQKFAIWTLRCPASSILFQSVE